MCSRQRAVYVMVVVAPARQAPLLQSCRPRPQPTPAASLETQQHLPASNAPVRQCLHLLVQSSHIQHQRTRFALSFMLHACKSDVHTFGIGDLVRCGWPCCSSRCISAIQNCWVHLLGHVGSPPGLPGNVCGSDTRALYIHQDWAVELCAVPRSTSTLPVARGAQTPTNWTMEERAHLRQTWPAGRPAAGLRHPQRSPSARCAGEASSAQRRHLMTSGHAPSRHPAHESDAALEEQQNRPQGSRLAHSCSFHDLQFITLNFSSPTSRRVESVLAAQEVRRQSGKGNRLHHSPVMRFTTVV